LFGGLTNALDVVPIVDPGESADHILFGRQWTLFIDHPPALRSCSQGVKHDSYTFRVLRMSKSGFVFKTQRMGADTDRRINV